MAYEVIVYGPARRYLKRAGQKVQQRIVRAIDALRRDPYAHSKPLLGLEGKRSCRVGHLRVILEIDEASKMVHLYTIAPRGDVYRRL